MGRFLSLPIAIRTHWITCTLLIGTLTLLAFPTPAIAQSQVCLGRGSVTTVEAATSPSQNGSGAILGAPDGSIVNFDNQSPGSFGYVVAAFEHPAVDFDGANDITLHLKDFYAGEPEEGYQIYVSNTGTNIGDLDQGGSNSGDFVFLGSRDPSPLDTQAQQSISISYDLQATGLAQVRFVLILSKTSDDTMSNEGPDIDAIEYLCDFDRDSIPDEVDLDDDNDGILDTEENGGGVSDVDTDGDGNPNRIDIDADNDGILDTIEAQDESLPLTTLSGIDSDRDGIDAAFDSDDNSFGGSAITPENTDGDSLSDYLDTDTDNDGVLDLIEGHDNDANGVNDHGIDFSASLGMDGFADSDADGLDDRYDTTLPSDILNNVSGSNAAIQDTDADSTRDWRDTDDDNDGFPTFDEDANNNGDRSDDNEDGDTHPDYLDFDQCVGDVNKDRPGACGCGVADTDSDNDGIADCNDLCPNDSNKTQAGICGCGVADTDSDSDGTADCNDFCPADSNKTASGICGCGVADTDSDNDGIADCNDFCPTDSNKTQAGICGCGVADTDSDNDGTADCNDLCPVDSNKTQAGICGCGVADTDSDNDGTADCNDFCPTDANKTEAGICGCGMEDTDSDGDGIADCNDLCPNDAAKSDAGVCGCGIADIDSDSDGVLDCNERPVCSDGEDNDGDGMIDFPEDPGCSSADDEDETNDIVKVLKSPIYTKFNTFLGQWNFLELFVRGSDALPVEVTLHNLLGQEMISKSYVIGADQQFDVDINALLAEACSSETPASCETFEDLDNNGIVDTYGLVSVAFDASGLDAELIGQLTNYRRDPESDSFSFAFIRVLRNPVQGPTYAMANTFDPQGMGYLVPNWAEVIFLQREDETDTRPARFTVNLYNQEGSLVRSQSVVLDPLREFDVQAGHEEVNADGSVTEAVYLLEVIPEDDTLEYFLSVARYSSNSPAAVEPDTYNYAFAVDGARGASEMQYVATSNEVFACGSTSNWIEVANTLDREVQASITYRDAKGEIISESQNVLAAKSQMHFNASIVLPSGEFGGVHVQTDVPDAAIVQSLTYVHDCESSQVLTAYALPGRTADNESVSASVNTFLSMENTLQVLSSAPEAQTPTLQSQAALSGSENGVELNLSGFASAMLTINSEAGFSVETDTYDPITMSSEPGSLIANLIRKRMQKGTDGVEKLDFAIPIPLR